jgi:hypothetical protein
MKYLLIISSIILLNLTLSAQLIYQSAPNNIQQVVTNIFGLQCENIGSVQVTGIPQAFGVFSNGQALGLNSGLVMSTGHLELDTVYNADYFSSTGFGFPGDNDINTVTPNGIPSYDALTITFNFTPTITDTIRFNYIFASEEYPEYAMSSFNDRFLFLVSENGGAATNVAVLPGTNTVVEINSVNHIVNPSLYIPNEIGSAAHSFFPFDGYTVPLQAKFFVQAGNTYTIKLVVADVGDDVFDSAIFLDEQGSYSSLSGTLAVNGNPATDGVIQIFDAAQDSTVVQPLYTLPVIAGAYNVDSVPNGNYHIRFLPDTLVNPGALPAYFTNGTTWQEATMIGLPCYFNGTDITSEQVTLSGNGGIFGTVFIDTSFQKAGLEPFSSAVVLLQNAVTEQIVAYEQTNATGNYGFTNIPLGTYRILIDVPYLPQNDTLEIVLTASNPEHGGVTYNVEPDGINGYISSLSVNELEHFASIYPNPSSDKITVRLTKNLPIQAELFDLTGKKLESFLSSNSILDFSVGTYQEGIYILKVVQENVSRSYKLEVKK